MGRTLKRVPLDFDYELGKVWKGYINPYAISCEYCDGGWSEEYVYIKCKMYNYPYKPNRKLKDFVKKLENLERKDSFGGNSLYKQIIDAAKEKGIEEDWHRCDKCEGSGIREDLKEKYGSWQSYDPPEGEGYQLWQTTTEGSPKSPVFKTLEELCYWCEKNATVFAREKATKEEWMDMLSKDFVLMDM